MQNAVFVLVILLISGCAGNPITGKFPTPEETPTLMPRSATYQDLSSLPEPAGKIITSVYAFQDQTGQYRPAPSSNFSTAVTQGATAMLNTALKDSGWFIPLEREGLQNLLTERKIIRAANKGSEVSQSLPPLASASVLLEGGIIAYESNVRTGGGRRPILWYRKFRKVPPGSGHSEPACCRYLYRTNSSLSQCHQDNSIP